jgi:CheY-like chemotaxis protein
MNREVLVVDDADDIRAITQLGLEMSRGWHVLTANSGQDALQMAATHAFDVILLDMMMPEMDGALTLRHLKADSRTESIPVILLTAKGTPLSSAEIQRLGANAVLGKPFHPLQLADQICNILGW